MRILIKKSKIIDIILIIILFLFVFNESLSKISSLFSYIDEIIIIMLILLFFFEIIRMKGKIKLQKYEKVIVISYFFIYLIGILGNILSEFQNSYIAIIVDMLSWTKFFIAYIGIVNIIKKDKVNDFYTYLINVGKILIIIGIILEILNLTTGLELAEPKYAKFGIKAFSFLGHPAFTSAILAGFVAIFLVKPKKSRIWIFLGLILISATLRAKSLAFACLVICSLMFFRKRIDIVKFLLMGVLILIVGWNQIQYYFLNSNASRARVLDTAIEIANDYFPIGGGFASFGTMVSGKYYSKAYEKYGLNDRWGFREDSYSFVADGGWATSIGEFGYIGTVLILGMIFLLVLSIKKRMKGKDIEITPYIALLGYLLISSTNEAAFNSNYALLYSIILAIIVRKQQIIGEQDE